LPDYGCIELIERENRVGLLQEIELALSDLADPDTQIETGRLLTADFVYIKGYFTSSVLGHPNLTHRVRPSRD
jgi:hypothetical protein